LCCCWWSLSCYFHYCNCAVAGGRYLVISFWPYEEEAIRSLWEGIKLSREFQKTIKKQEFQIVELQEEVDSLKIKITEKDETISSLKKNIRYNKRQQEKRQREYEERQAARQRAYEERQSRNQQMKEERARRNVQRRFERQRNERFRLLDPIHIYALDGNSSGVMKEDWKLVIDYHKGAHDIRLGHLNPDGSRALDITENDKVFQFDLVELKMIKFFNSILLLLWILVPLEIFH